MREEPFIVYKDHKVVRLADLKKENIEFIITRENPCKSHPHHRLELFCEDCDDDDLLDMLERRSQGS